MHGDRCQGREQDGRGQRPHQEAQQFQAKELDFMQRCGGAWRGLGSGARWGTVGGGTRGTAGAVGVRIRGMAGRWWGSGSGAQQGR